ncbi:hypothetical protein [Lichenicoccus sp.]|uniref:hypothetical protein n=1 Tax=Lichenicoccus sp. TaxID=2781899 RepID=UPI003D13FF5B
MPSIVASCCGAASGRKRVFLIGGVVAVLVVATLAWKWSWLVAAGMIPILISVAPCMLMCGLGLCMKGRGSSTKTAASRESANPAIQISAPLSAVGYAPSATPPRESSPAPEHAALT